MELKKYRESMIRNVEKNIVITEAMAKICNESGKFDKQNKFNCIISKFNDILKELKKDGNIYY
jgi:hypothetical protein